MVLYAEPFNKLNRRVNLLTCARTPRKLLLWRLYDNLVMLRQSLVIVEAVLADSVACDGNPILWRRHVLAYRLSDLLFGNLLLELVKVDEAAISGDDNGTLAKFIELHPTYLVARAERLRDCIDRVHASRL